MKRARWLRWGVVCAVVLMGSVVRVAAMHAAALQPGELVRGSQEAVYYIAPNGKRYAFPNERVYASWFGRPCGAERGPCPDFSSVRLVSDAALASAPLADVVRYRPGERLVKVVSDPKVYAVTGWGVLQWVPTEDLARAMEGASWSDAIDDLPDAFFPAYTIGAPLTEVGDAALLRGQLPSISTGLGFATPRKELPRTYGDRSTSVVFTVTVPAWTPTSDHIFLRIEDFYSLPDGGFPMFRVASDPRTWQVTIMRDSGISVRYRYNRNNEGYATGEVLVPDRPETWRTVRTGAERTDVRDTVAAWRWLDHPPPTATLRDDEPAIAVRAQPFVLGIAPLDYFTPRLTQLLPETLSRIASRGFTWVNFSYAAATIMSVDPLRMTRPATNTFSRDALAYAIAEARVRGLRVMLSAGIESDPASIAALDAQLAGAHDDAWVDALVAAWTDALVDTAQFAHAHGVEVFTPSNQWPFWGLTAAQRAQFNGKIRDTYRTMREVFGGVITSDFYSDESGFDFYEELDWIGDKWWWPIASSYDPNIEELTERAERVVERYAAIAERYGKPVFLSQLAYGSYDGASGAYQRSTESEVIAEWFPADASVPADFQEQADAYEAVFRAIADAPFIQGAIAFSYAYWDTHDKATGIRAKPAERVWERWNRLLQGTPP